MAHGTYIEIPNKIILKIYLMSRSPSAANEARTEALDIARKIWGISKGSGWTEDLGGISKGSVWTEDLGGIVETGGHQ
eukprot:SAG22_NODE_19576_length_273_cov_1.183908_1_plen_77_part_01